MIQRYRRDLWTTIQLIILLFFDSCQSLEKKITPLSVVPYSKNAPIIYSLWQRRGSISGRVAFRPGSFLLHKFLSHFYDPSHARKISLYIYIYFPRCPSASPFFETIPRSKYEIDEANVKKGKIRRRSENKRRKEKDRIGRRKARGAGK